MELHNFLNEYPIFSKDVYDILGNVKVLNKNKEEIINILENPDKATYDIFRKKEFNELQLEKIEMLSVEKDFLNHQKIISRFMSPYTTNNGILLFHGLGCLHPDTPVLLWNGTIKSAKDVQLHEKLIGDDGTPRTVQKLIRGKSLMYKIEQSNADTYIVNKDHILTLVFIGDVLCESYKIIKKKSVNLNNSLIIDINISEYISLNDSEKKLLRGIKFTSVEWNKNLSCYLMEKMVYSTIKITELEEGFYYGWNLDGNQRFLLGDNTITHNSGKSCTSIATSELIKNTSNNNYKRCLFLAKGINLIQNFINELVYKCTKDVYTLKEDDDATELEKLRRINRNISTFYSFETFEKMSTNIIDAFDDQTLSEKYSNYIIIIDEVHNLRLTNDKSTYSSFHRFLHAIKNCKIILLSGTPMRDSPEEIATIMNLILPLNFQLPIGKNFTDTFLEKKNNIPVLNQSKVSLLKKYFHGRISYLQTMTSDVKVEYMGNYKINYLNLYPLTMEEFQYKNYLQAFEKDKISQDTQRTGVYNDSRQASSFVFPDGTYGSVGFKKYLNIPKKNKKGGKIQLIKTSYSLKSDFLNEFKNYNTNDSKIKKLREYSAKYSECIKKIIENKGNHFVYMEFVEGSGAILFSKILEKLFGFSESKGEEDTKKDRYAIITNRTATTKEIRNILQLQNSSKNKDGEYLKVIIGSGIIGEGFSLKNIQYIHILTPDWNFAGTEQAIFRGLRLFSHKDLEESGVDVTVKIYLYCLNLPKSSFLNESIDELMFKTCEDKDISIKSVERAMKEASFDCPLNRKRNITTAFNDGSRECDYQNCKYACDFIDEKDYENVDIDYSTYNLFYSKKMLDVLINKIKDVLSKYTKVKIQELYKLTSDKFIVLKAIYIMETVPYIITDRFGYNCFVKHDNDYIYLTHSIGKTNFFDNYYVENFPLQEYGNFKSLLSELEDERSCSVIEKMREIPFEDKKLELFNKFSPEAREIMLEIVLNEIHKNPDIINQDSLFKLIFDNLKYYVIDSNNISTLLQQSQNIFRCRKNDGTWYDCNEEETKKILNILSEKKKTLENVKYYGIKETSTQNFYIRDISNEEKKTGKEGKHKVSTGKECTTWQKFDLLKLIDILNIPFEGKDIDDVKNKTVKELIVLIGNEKDSDKKDILKAFTEDELNKKSQESLIRIIKFGRLKKAPICSTIENYFEKNNIIDRVLTKSKIKEEEKE
jgi:hypothetical protein